MTRVTFCLFFHARGAGAGAAPRTRMHIPYPFNGKVLNTSNFPVRVWNDQKLIHYIPPRSSSDFNREDIDYIEDTYGIWWKISALRDFGFVIVQPDGRVTGVLRRAFIH